MTRARTDFRSDFNGMQDCIYLNCAYQGPLPRVAADAVRDALAQKESPHRIADNHYFDVPDDYRRAVGELIGAAADHIAVADSTTHGVMLLVNGLDWNAGDEVIVPGGAFPANDFPWRSLEARGVRVVHVDVSGTRDTVDAVRDHVSSRTRVVALSWVTYSSGRRHDVAAVGQLCRELGIIYMIDGSQGIGGLEFDLGQTPCDLLACSGYKWLLGPYGGGFAYVDPELGDRLRLGNINWQALVGARDFNRLSRCELEFVPGASRFDVNETANFMNLAAATASIRYLGTITPRRVEAHVGGLLDRLVEGLPYDFQPAGPRSAARRSNILCVRASDPARADAAFERLTDQRIFLSRREGAVRLSPHIYNNEQDIDAVLDVLHDR